jgi:hypothetical protein
MKPASACPVLAAVLLALVPAAASARAAQAVRPRGEIDLRTEANVTIVGARNFDFAGAVTADAGDVNGDGVDDVIIGAPGVDGPGRPDAGAAYIVFGQRAKRGVRRRSMTARGFRILGAAPGEGLGISVAPAGDWNGDGLADVVVGTSSRGQPVGKAYVVYGKKDGATVDLAVSGARATAITGVPTLGQLVAGGRDVDGDGKPDVAIGALMPDGPPTDGGGPPSKVYVIRGGTTTEPIDVTNLGDRGSVINTRLLLALALTSDMNGDGRAEIAIGRMDQGIPLGPDGAVGPVPASVTLGYVVFGHSGPATVDTAALGDGGFTVIGQGPMHGLGTSYALAGGGDVNGDGRGDVAFGDGMGNAAVVVFGAAGSDTVTVGDPARTMVVTGRPAGGLGQGVAIVGDVNGDGLADVLTGNPGETARGRKDAGHAYLVYGRRTGGTTGLPRRGRGGIVFDGAAANDYIGFSLASAGDFNGDGRPDLLIGARPNFPSMLFKGPGAAFIVYGSGRRR